MAHSLNFMATSGLYGMMLAVQRCKEVVIYGFHVSTTHGALYHYYDVCDVPANVLRDDTEWLAVKALMTLMHNWRTVPGIGEGVLPSYNNYGKKCAPGCSSFAACPSGP